MPISTGIHARFLSKAHLTASAPFRARAHGSLSGQLYEHLPGEDPALRHPLSCCLSDHRHSLLSHPVPPAGFRPHYCRPTALPAHTRACTADPGEVYTFRTRETRTGPGALCTPWTAVSAGHRPVRGRRLPPLNGRSIASRHNCPAWDVCMTRHLREFPGSRPIPVLPLACGRHGWDGGSWAFPRAPDPADQEPAAHVAVGTGRTQTRSYVFDIRRPPRQAHSPRATSCRNRTCTRTTFSGLIFVRFIYFYDLR